MADNTVNLGLGHPSTATFSSLTYIMHAINAGVSLHRNMIVNIYIYIYIYILTCIFLARTTEIQLKRS